MKIIDLSGEYTEKMWYYGEPYTPYSVKILRVSIKMAISQENIH